MPRAFSSGRLVDLVEGREGRLARVLARPATLVMAAVSVVLPWSMWPIVPMLRCGLFALELLLGHGGSLTSLSDVWLGRYSPRTRATISLGDRLGTCWYEWNCIVYVARPWVRERRSVA